MTQQLNIFSGESLKEKGMRQALQHADKVEHRWSEKAYQVLLDFLSHLPEDRKFMTEQFRKYAYENGLPAPPSERAHGSVIRRAAIEGKIIRVGFGQVTNPKAHCANSSVWRKV